MPSRSALETSSAAASGKLPAKTASRAKSSWLARIEQVVAPLDRRAQRALALGHIARAAGQERENRVEALEEQLGREELRPGGGELDREREAVEAAADRLDRRVGCELPPDGTRTLDEERRSVVGRQRLEPVLPLARDVQRRPARGEHAHPGAGAEDRADGRRRLEQVLEVVEEEQELPAAEKPGQVVGRSQRLRDLGVEERGVGEADERHPEDAVALGAHELGRDLEREPGLPRAARPGEREEARAVREQRDELLELVLPPHERARGDGQVRGVERPERREVAVAELVQALGSDQVLQTVLAEVADGRVRLEEPTRRLGEDDLPAVGRRGDPRRAVDVDPHVALVRDDRLAGVDSHADADRAPLERLTPVGCRGDRVGGSGERDEEGVTLRVDLDAAVPRERLPQRAAVVVEEVCVSRPVLLEEPSRALDVREEEGDGAGRQVWPAHGAIISPRRARRLRVRIEREPGGDQADGLVVERVHPRAGARRDRPGRSRARRRSRTGADRRPSSRSGSREPPGSGSSVARAADGIRHDVDVTSHLADRGGSSRLSSSGCSVQRHFESTTQTPDGTMTTWSMVEREPGTRRSCRTIPVSPSSRSSTTATCSSPTRSSRLCRVRLRPRDIPDQASTSPRAAPPNGTGGCAHVFG